MAREINRLSARKVGTVSKPGRYADGGNLYLVVTPQRGRKWAFLYRWHGKQKEMGLGKAGKGGVSLAKARDLADKARDHLADGHDPIVVKHAARNKSAKAKTFVQAFAVGLALLPALADVWWPADVVLWAAVFLAVYSAAQYVLDGARAATTMERA